MWKWLSVFLDDRRSNNSLEEWYGVTTRWPADYLDGRQVDYYDVHWWVVTKPFVHNGMLFPKGSTIAYFPRLDRWHIRTHRTGIGGSLSAYRRILNMDAQ